MTRRARRGDRLVVAIGAFKLIKCGLLLAFGLGWLFGLVRGGSLVRTAGWTGALAGHHAVRGVLARLAALDDRLMRELAIAALIYAAVFAVEGTGLLLRRRWAEWLTVVVTASFIPIEIYELARRPGVGKAIAIAINVAIVATLAWRRAAADVPRPSRFRAA